MTSQSLTQRDKSYLWHPYTQMRTAPSPLPIVKAKGIYLYSEDGKKILDGISSWWVNIHGHSHPRLNQALAEQASKFEHVMFAGCTHSPAVDLAERLLALLPKNLKRVFYSDNGSTAVEVALKMAHQYWRNIGQPQRQTFVTLHNAYHGDTIGTMSVSEDSVFTRAFEPFLFPVLRAHSPYCYRCPLSLDRSTCQIECLNSLEEHLNMHRDEVAGVLVEPMLQAAGGMVIWPSEFLAGVRALCDKYDTLLIADEVLTGFGRTGRMFACEHAQIEPDILCLSKALTAGYLPLAATVASAKIYDAFLSEDRSRTFFHGHSYTANPLACAVGLASLDLFRDGAVLKRISRLEEQLRTGLKAIKEIAIVGDVRVIGGVAVIELETDSGGYLDQLGPKLTSMFLARGLLLRPLGNILYFMPPYVITDEEVDWVIDQIHAVLNSVSS